MAESTNPKPAGAPSDNGRTMAILAYFLFFIPLLAAKDDKFAMYHANQGLILLLAYIVAGFLSLFLFGLPSLLVFVLWVMGIVNAAQGQMKPVPLIGNVTLLK